MIKHLVLILSVFVFALCTLANPGNEALAKSTPHILYKGTVTAYNLNVRKAPNKSSQRIGMLKKGTIVSVLQSGEWLTISYKNSKAYVSHNYVKRIYYSKTYRINAPIYRQFPQLPRGCEVTSLSMLLNYAGKHVSKMTLAYQIHKVPYWIGRYHGNPHDGFVGNMYTYSKPGYGVYHEPVFTLAKRYLGKRARDLSGKSWSSVEAQIRAKKPVWVIVNTRYRYLSQNTLTTWRTRRGRIKISMHEHSVLVTGYNASSVYINDPYTGKKNMKLNKNNFISGWKEFGRQAISFK